MQQSNDTIMRVEDQRRLRGMKAQIRPRESRQRPHGSAGRREEAGEGKGAQRVARTLRVHEENKFSAVSFKAVYLLWFPHTSFAE